MYLGIPQIIYILLNCVSLGIIMSKHGQPKTGNENFFITLIAQIICYSLLIWGGFFSN